MCTEGGFQLRWYIEIQLKVGLVIWCAITLKEATVYSHYNKTNLYVIGTKDKSLDFGMT